MKFDALVNKILSESDDMSSSGVIEVKLLEPFNPKFEEKEQHNSYIVKFKNNYYIVNHYFNRNDSLRLIAFRRDSHHRVFFDLKDKQEILNAILNAEKEHQD